MGRAKRSGDPVAEKAAHATVNAVKKALGERGPPWWNDEAADLNRHLVRNTQYAGWYEEMNKPPYDPNGVKVPCLSIGTAGWSIPKAVASAFPDEGSHLERYAAVMTATEINSSFHKPHRRSTYARWAASTPERFQFSVKVPKEISHTRKLVDTGELLDIFADQIVGLGAKLHVVLLQLPPSLAFERSLASTFFAALRQRLDRGIEIAAEPRHASWFTEPGDQCLVEHRVARVAADPALAPGAEHPGGWSGLHYRRLHGSPRVYYSAYDEQRLAIVARAMASDRASGVPSWCIFDNTASGAALGDALELRKK